MYFFVTRLCQGDFSCARDQFWPVTLSDLMTPISYRLVTTGLELNKLCAWRYNMSPPLSSPPVGAQAPRAPPSRGNVAVLSHAEYVPTLTAAATLCVKAALSKAAW